MKVVAYMRVSTDDKGQDPERQKGPILIRCARDGLEVVGWVWDEGTSGGVPAMERPRVQEAIRLAKKLGARGLIVESVDRWTRAGTRDLAVSMYLLEREHRMVLHIADVQGDELVVELLTPIMATLARLERKRKIDQGRSSVALRRSRGDPIGRPPKPPLEDDELLMVANILASRKGYGTAAVEVSKLRGAHEIADPKAARRLRVSPGWIRDQLASRGDACAMLGIKPPKPAHPRRNSNTFGAVSEQGQGNPVRKEPLPATLAARDYRASP